MTSTPLNWNLETQVDPDLEYKALLRSLKFTEGFGLLFVQCSPAEGERLIAKVRKDLQQKRIEVLSLTEPIETLYDRVNALHRNKPFDVLFVQGMEYSLYDYEKKRFWSNDEQRLNYSETGVPRLLQHLNLSREHFRESFPIQFVFLIPHFVLKYLIRRAPDFFDWNSGVLEFTRHNDWHYEEEIESIRKRARTLNNPVDWANLDEMLAHTAHESDRHKFGHNQVTILNDLNQYEEIITSYEKVTGKKLDKSQAWLKRGIGLSKIKKYEEAVASYDKAIEYNPYDYQAWYRQGIALSKLGRYREAVTSYSKALESLGVNSQRLVVLGVSRSAITMSSLLSKSYFGEGLNYNRHTIKTWNNQGAALSKLGRYEEAIASYDKALQLKPNDGTVWYNRGIALRKLGRYQDVITSFDKALEFNPEDHQAWNNRGMALFNLGRYEEAIASYHKALQFKSDKDTVWYNQAIASFNLGRYEEAIASYDTALQLKPNNDLAWYNRGNASFNLGRYKEAIASYDQALKLNPNDPRIFYSKACSYALQANLDDAIANLSYAIELNPDKYREMAKTDSDFDSIRENEHFQALMLG